MLFLYVYDLRLFKIIVKDSEALQNDVAKLGLWCQKKGMILNATECVNMTFTHRIKGILKYPYKINDSVLYVQEVDTVRDLGELLDKKNYVHTTY